jgi:tripartite-type tricarboxylate transporter receptor subunit TctC
VKLPHRRQFLHLATGVTALPALSRIARAEGYPTKPVRIIVGFAAGGPTDITARLIGQGLSERLGQPVIVENRPGASGNIAAEAVAHAPPDGYTLGLIGVWNTINASLFQTLKFNIVKDIVPIAGVIRYANVMEVDPSLPTKTLPEFVAYAKANPGKINMASPGSGTSQHLSGELFKMMAGVDLPAVQYRGSGPALTDLIGGHVQVMFDAIPSSIEHIKSGKLRGLAVTTAARSDVLPNLPTVGDFVSGYEASGWNGIGAPEGTPLDVVDKLHAATAAALADPKMQARLAELGGTPIKGTPADFGKLIADEADKWAKVIKFAGIKAE